MKLPYYIVTYDADGETLEELKVLFDDNEIRTFEWGLEEGMAMVIVNDEGQSIEVRPMEMDVEVGMIH